MPSIAVVRNNFLGLLLGLAATLGCSQDAWAQSSGSWIIERLGDNLSPRHLIFADSQVGYCGGTFIRFDKGDLYRLFRTEDGGTTWTRLTYGGTLNPDPRYLAAPTREDLFLLWTFQSYGVMASTDGGASWVRRMKNPTGASTPPDWLTMVTPSVGYRDGKYQQPGFLTISSDSADSYFSVSSDNTYEDWRTAPATYIYADFSDTAHFTYILRTSLDTGNLPVLTTLDGGGHWKAVWPQSQKDSLSRYGLIRYLRGTPHVWLTRHAGANQLYHSSDYGQSWLIMNTPPLPIKLVAPIASNKLWAIANSSFGSDSLSKQHILYTENGGNSWTIDSTTLSGFQATHIEASDSTHAWIALRKDTSTYIARYETNTQSVENSGRPLPLTLYPNPALNVVHANLPVTAKINQIMATNVLGDVTQLTWKASGKEIAIDTSPLRPGSYWIKIEAAKNYSFEGKLLVH